MNSQNYLKWRYQWMFRRLRRLVFSRLYRDSNQDLHRSILVAGTARSGTTWLGDILASQLNGRTMFEPFHSRKVKAFGRFNYFQYMRPNEKNEELAAFCRRIFSGDIRDKWIDGYVEILSPDYRIIKEIRANLFLKWIKNQFPQVPQVFIIRHPCSVVLSRMSLDWDTDRDIDPFLTQSKLVEDFLGDKMDVIQSAALPEEKHTIIWCVSNLIPLRQFQQDELQIVFYEHLCIQLEKEISRIFQSIQLDYHNLQKKELKVPSMTARATSAIVAGEDNLSLWQRKLNPQQIDRILRVVEAFGLDYLYSDSSTPQSCNPFTNSPNI